MSRRIPCCTSRRARSRTTAPSSSRRSRRSQFSTPCPPCFIARSCSPALRQRSGHQRFWRCAGVTSCEKRKESGGQSAGRMAKTARPRRMHRTAMFRCIPSWRSIARVEGPDAPQERHGLRVSFLKGRRPRPPLPFAFVADHLRLAAKKAGVQIEDGRRFGLHNLRHSLSNWLVNKAKVEPKTVQGILRHSRIQTTLDLYTQKDSDEARAAQGEFLQALGMRSELVQ